MTSHVSSPPANSTTTAGLLIRTTVVGKLADSALFTHDSAVSDVAGLPRAPSVCAFLGPDETRISINRHAP